MKIKMTTHFEYRFGVRDADIDQVKRAIKNPDTKEILISGKVKVTRNIDTHKKIVVVYYREEYGDKKNEYLLITAYYKDI